MEMLLLFDETYGCLEVASDGLTFFDGMKRGQCYDEMVCNTCVAMAGG